MGVISRMQAYLRVKDKEADLKKHKEKVKAIVKSLILDKTPKQSIEMFKEIKELFDEKLDEQLKASLEAVEEITNYKRSNQKI